MNIGLWNIDHPEHNISNRSRYKRFSEISEYLRQQDCDFYIITEANAAIQLKGYLSHFSDESPFLKKDRCYAAPNRYHQVGIYSKWPLEQVEICEPINGVLCKSIWQKQPVVIYGNVITIKDQWKNDSNKTYKDRVNEQIREMGQLVNERFIVGGDFNLKRGWSQKKVAYNQIKEFVTHKSLLWPTEEQTTSVQHVIHSPLFITKFDIDSSVQHQKGKSNSLSDHPFILLEVEGI